MRLKETLNVLGKTHKTIETFLLQQEKKLKKLQDCYENVLIKSYKIKFIDSAGLMASSL